ncbi:MAG: cyclic nucleotide-binding domain-containing protein [Candidatus Marinimicrobia bacterium]|nr:cyclic nucleotide-binding domain-containing protein [Candidatus Neomarinimicrobiota bacterium]
MEVLELSELVEFKPGEVIFSEGDPGDCMYIVRRGEIEVIKHLNGEPVIITRMGPDQIFGEMALVAQRSRSATVRAITDVECQLIGGEVFRRKWAEVPAWMQDLYGLVVERLRVTTRKYNPHSGHIPGFQIVELLSMLAREAEATGEADVSMPMKMIITRMTYMFDIPKVHVRMILDLLLESSLLTSEFDASQEDKIVSVDLPNLEKFSRYVRKIDASGRDAGESTGNAQAEEYEFLKLLNQVYKGQAKISTSDE